jgi:hypothetical protein
LGYNQNFSTGHVDSIRGGGDQILGDPHQLAIKDLATHGRGKKGLYYGYNFQITYRKQYLECLNGL